MKFAHQPGLAHPRFTGNSDQLNTRLPGGPVKRTLQSDELSLTANKGSGRWQDFGRRPGPDTDSFPQLQGFAFPPDHGRRQALVSDAVARQPLGQPSHHHRARRGRMLQPRCHVHHVAGDEMLTNLGSGGKQESEAGSR